MIRTIAPTFHDFLLLDMEIDFLVVKNIPFPAFSPIFVFGIPWALYFCFLCIYLPATKKQSFGDGFSAWLQLPYYVFLVLMGVVAGEGIYRLLIGLFDGTGFAHAAQNIGESFQIRATIASSAYAKPMEVSLRLTAFIGFAAGYYFLVNRGIREALIKLSPGFFKE
jgi:hypothetical protein